MTEADVRAATAATDRDRPSEPSSDPAMPTLPDPVSRGVTRISPVVVERVAAWACRVVEDTWTRDARPGDQTAPPTRVRAEVSGSSAHLSVTIGVRYPTPIAGVARAVRSAVADEVQRTCELSVHGVDVEPVPVAAPVRSRVR